MKVGALLVWPPGCKFEAITVCIQSRKPSLILAEGGRRHKSCQRLSGSMQLQTRADSGIGFFSGGSLLEWGRQMRKGAVSHLLRPPPPILGDD